MRSESDQLSKREASAREYIAAIYGSPEDEYGATLFVSHHLSEIEPRYWKKHTGVSQPSAHQVLGILELLVDSDDDEIDSLDFSLPDDATNYMISVQFDDSGSIYAVSMES